MQDIIIRCPSEVLDEEGLIYVGREVRTGNRRLDIVLKDRMERFVLLEAQIGHLDTNHIDRHIDFSMGYKKDNPEKCIRLMYVAFYIDIHRKEFLHSRGYEFKEVSENNLLALAKKYNLIGQESITVSEERDSQRNKAIKPTRNKTPRSNKVKLNEDDFFNKIKNYLKIEQVNQLQAIINDLQENHSVEIDYAQDSLTIIFDGIRILGITSAGEVKLKTKLKKYRSEYKKEIDEFIDALSKRINPRFTDNANTLGKWSSKVTLLPDNDIDVLSRSVIEFIDKIKRIKMEHI